MWPSAVNVIPAAAVEGTLLYIGLTGVFHTQLWSRIVLMLSDWRLYSESVEESPLAGVRPLRMHAYTLVQLGAIGVAWLVQALPPAVGYPTLGLLFPLWIVALVPARLYLLPKLFSAEELHALDPGSERIEPASEAGGEYGSFVSTSKT